MMHGCCSGSKTSWEGTTIDGRRRRELALQQRLVRLARLRRPHLHRARLRRTGATRAPPAQTQLDSRPVRDQRLPAPGRPARRPERRDPERRRQPDHRPAADRARPAGPTAAASPGWRSPTRPGTARAATPMKVVAAATKYGWTNLVESLVPRGDDRRDSLPETDPATVKSQLATTPGFPKRSINAALYASGKTGVPPGQRAYDLRAGHRRGPGLPDRPAGPGTAQPAVREHPRHHAAAVHRRALGLLPAELLHRAGGRHDRPVPVFSAGTFTDKLFPAAEHRRMVERLKSAPTPGLPGPGVLRRLQPLRPDQAQGVRRRLRHRPPRLHLRRLPRREPQRQPAHTEPRARCHLTAEPLHRSLRQAAGQRRRADARRFDVTGALQVCPGNAVVAGPRRPTSPARGSRPTTFAALGQNSLQVNAPGHTGRPPTPSRGQPARARTPTRWATSLTNGGALPRRAVARRAGLGRPWRCHLRLAGAHPRLHHARPDPRGGLAHRHRARRASSTPASTTWRPTASRYWSTAASSGSRARPAPPPSTCTGPAGGSAPATSCASR